MEDRSKIGQIPIDENLDNFAMLVETREALLVDLTHFVVFDQGNEDPESRHFVPTAVEKDCAHY